MKRIYFLITAVLLAANLAFAAPRNSNEAKKVVKGWLKTSDKPLNTALGRQIDKVDAYSDEIGEPVYYIVHLKPSGFVIVSADDEVEPIIGFASGGSYDDSPENCLKALVESDIPKRVAAAREIAQKVSAEGKDKLAEREKAVYEVSIKAKGKWAELEAYADDELMPMLAGVSDVRVPALVASRWSQGDAAGGHCYNYYTPNNYWCGCVATAFAQLVRYFEHQPAEGIGVHAFGITVDGNPQTAYTRGGDGSGGPYNWSDLVLVPESGITTTQRQAIGSLCYDCGVTVNMMYAGAGSAAHTIFIRNALINIFGYSQAIEVMDDWYSTDSDLLDIINPNLDAGLPVFCCVRDEDIGHAVICDGYGYDSSIMYHHINMGWGGLEDAWYNLPNVYHWFVFYEAYYNVYTSGDGEIISGRVTDISGTPISGASVVAQRSEGGTYSAITDIRGIYALAKVPYNSSYHIRATKTGYWFTSQDVSTGISTTGGSSTPGNRWAIDFVETLSPEPPEADDVAVSALSNGAVTIILEAIDDGKPNPPGALGYIITSLPSDGELSDASAGTIVSIPYILSGNGNQVVYTPDAEFRGYDSFQYKANDGGTAPEGGDSNIANVLIEVSVVTVEYQVSSSDDDGWASGPTSQDTTSEVLYAGSGSSYGVPYRMAGMCFRNVNIPKAATITRAHLKLRWLRGTSGFAVYGQIQAEDTDDADGFGGRYMGGLAKTTTAVDWDHPNGWGGEYLYISPDIADVIQEVVDRPGWSQNNALAIFYSARISSGKYCWIKSYDYLSTDAPKLEISYTIPRRALTASSTAGGTVITPGEGTYHYDNWSIANIAATPESDYHFVCWTGSGVDGGKVADPNSADTAITMDSDYTVVANFAIDTFTLDYAAGPGGTLTGETSQIVGYGANGTPVTAVPDTGYHFANWSDASTDNPRTDLNVIADISVTANFAIDTFTLEYIAGANGTLTGETAQVVDYGTNGTAVTAVADAGYHFVNWSDASTGNPRTDLNVTANISVTANFAIDTFTLDYAAGPGGTLTGETSQVVDYGTNGTAVTAVPNAGYHFVNWSDASTDNPRTDLNVTVNLSVTANFAIDQMFIFGYVTEPDANVPVEGVVVDANNGGGSDVTDANGYYELAVDYGWSGAVTPSKAGYTFEPNSMAYDNVITDCNDGYIGILDTFVISGYVVDSQMYALEGVLVTSDNDGGPFTSKYYSGQDTTDANGYYEVVVDRNWSGKVVPSKYAYVFEPNSITYSNITEDTAEQQYYIGTLLTSTISGYVRNSCGDPIEGVQVGSGVTDANGYYESWVDYNWSGTLVPVKQDYAFDPNYMSYANVLDDIPDQNYVAYNIYDLDGDCCIGTGDLWVLLQNWLASGPDTPGNFNGDETLDLIDFAVFAQRWHQDMVWVSISDPGIGGGHEGFGGKMSKYETTNAQYCQYLNAAKVTGDITVIENYVYGASGSNPGADFEGEAYYDLAGPGWTGDGGTNGGAARIKYSGGLFSVDSGFEDHPVTYVSWYGATAFCNYYGWRLPTEWEWQAVADYDGNYTYGCGITINNNIANYLSSTHPYGTTAVGAFGEYGYGMCDMAGNVWEWTSSIYSGSYRIRGGCWSRDEDVCYVTFPGDYPPYSGAYQGVGFRVCR